VSFGKMTTPVVLIGLGEYSIGDDGSAVDNPYNIKRTFAYMEQRNFGKRWINLAEWTEASVMFRLCFDPSLVLDDIRRVQVDKPSGKTYKVLSIENVRGRSMYIEILAELIEPLRMG